LITVRNASCRLTIANSEPLQRSCIQFPADPESGRHMILYTSFQLVDNHNRSWLNEQWHPITALLAFNYSRSLHPVDHRKDGQTIR